MPPRLSRALLGWIAQPQDRASLIADLDEEYVARARASGTSPATRWYRRQVLMSVWPLGWSRLGLARAPAVLRLDARAAWLSLRAGPALSVAAIATLALGTSVTVTAFSALRAVLIDDLPFPRPDRIVAIGNRAYSKLQVDRWFEASRDSFEVLAGYREALATVMGGGEPTQETVIRATPELFDVIGVPVAQGRPLSSGDGERDNRVAVVSHGFWTDRLGGREVGAGLSMRIDGEPWTIVGVLARGVGLPRGGAAIWIPVTDRDRDSPGLRLIARLRAGATIERTNALLAGTFAAWLESREGGIFLRGYADGAASAEATGPPPRPSPPSVMSLRAREVGDAGRRVLLAQGAASFVLLIACANLACLMLARTTTRSRELVTRMALGATRTHIVRQLIAESALLSMLGAGAGFMLAWWVVPLLASQYQGASGPAFDLAPRVMDLVAAVGAASVAVATAGVLPAWMVVRRLPVVMREAPAIGPGSRALRHTLVAGEVALALVLVIGATLLVQSYARLTGQPLGFDPSHVLALRMALPDERYDDAGRSKYVSDLLDQIDREPWTIAVGATSLEPFRDQLTMASLAFENTRGEARALAASYRQVSPGFFATLGIPIRRGRTFHASDDDSAPAVMIVNERLAAEYGDADAVVGRTLDWLGSPRTVVGVVGDTTSGYGSPVRPEVYLPFGQTEFRAVTILARVESGSPDELARLRTLGRQADPDLAPVVVGLSSIGRATVAAQVFARNLMGGLALLAALLAGLGIFGVTSHVSALRTREIGIRLALGAGRGDVRWLMFREGMAPVACGLAAGLAGGWMLTRLLDAQLFGVSARDPAAFAVAMLSLLAVAGAACWNPARRASRANPVDVLRAD